MNDNNNEKELEELMQEHHERLIKKSYNTYGFFNLVYRILHSMIDDSQQRKFFTLHDMGRYETTGQPLKASTARALVNDLVRAEVLREIVLPQKEPLYDYGKITYQSPYKDNEANEIVQQETIQAYRNKSMRKIRKSTYYTVTDKGRTIYKHLLEILEMCEPGKHYTLS